MSQPDWGDSQLSHVQVASCTFRGEPTGPVFAATARRLHRDERAAALRIIRRAHPFMFGVVIRARYAVKRTEAALFALSDLRALG